MRIREDDTVFMFVWSSPVPSRTLSMQLFTLKTSGLAALKAAVGNFKTNVWHICWKFGSPGSTKSCNAICKNPLCPYQTYQSEPAGGEHGVSMTVHTHTEVTSPPPTPPLTPSSSKSLVRSHWRKNIPSFFANRLPKQPKGENFTMLEIKQDRRWEEAAKRSERLQKWWLCNCKHPAWFLPG